MTKIQTIAAMSERTGISKVLVRDFFDELMQLAYREAKGGFVLPGIGKLVLVDRKARVGRNPATGETINIPARKVVKFRVSKACKEAVLSG